MDSEAAVNYADKAKTSEQGVKRKRPEVAGRGVEDPQDALTVILVAPCG